MFQAGEPQESLWQSEFLITPRKAKLMRRSWAQVFRNEALVLIEEERFAPMYSPDMGRPNRAVQTVLGVLVLKEMLDLTDMEALEELEFNLLWHHALRLEMEEAHLAQKTLRPWDCGQAKQRLDSTHVMSNIAVLTRLGLFCETVRVFLLAVSREHPGLGEGIGDGLAQRYLKETGEASRYEDARSGEGRRRLSVCARDMCRLVDRFRGTAVAKMEEYGLLERLLHEQCHVGRHRDGRPSADDDDQRGTLLHPVADLHTLVAEGGLRGEEEAPRSGFPHTPYDVLGKIFAVELVHALDDGLHELARGGVVGVLGDGHHPDALAPEHGLEGDGVLSLSGEPRKLPDEDYLKRSLGPNPPKDGE